MNDTKDLLRTGFVIYCVYAIYSSLVVFFRPNNPGVVFGSLRIPILVFLYFLAPCVSLYLHYRAFWNTHAGTFWVGLTLVFPLSFFIMLYFLSSPDWPVGAVLQLQKMPSSVVIVLLSLNMAVSVVVAGGSAITLYLRPAAIESSARAQEYKNATDNIAKLQNEEKAQQAQVEGIKREATSAVFQNWSDILKVFISLLTAVVTFATSMITLNSK
jgi:hypothetical protein